MQPGHVAVSFGTSILLATAAPVHAEPDSNRWSITALAGTDVPLDIAAGLQLETPFRLRLTGTAGWLPRPYARALRDDYVSVYDGAEPVGELLEDAMAGAFVAHGQLGLRPFRDHGFVISAGYAWAANDRDGLLAGEIEGAGSGVLAAADRIGRTFATKLRVHIVDGQLGWQWGIGPGLMLRASLGAQKIVHTTTSLSPSFTPAEPATVARVIDVAERRLEDAGTGLWAPQGSVYLGYTF